MDNVEEVVEEIPQEEGIETEVADQESTESAEVVSESDEREERNARNWKQANEARKRLERELSKKDEQLDELMRALPKQTQPQEVDELSTIEADAYIPKGTIDKLLAKHGESVREQAKKEVENIFKEKEKARWKERLLQKYPDFEDVVNVDTLDLLEQEDPEVAETLNELKDPYKAFQQSYKLIKAYGLSNQVGKSKRRREVEKKLEANDKTVPSPQAYDKRPLAQAMMISDAEKTALYEEMVSSASRAGGGY